MSRLNDLLTPIPTKPPTGFIAQATNKGLDIETRDFDLYMQNNFEYLKALRGFAMPTELSNSNFNTLSGKGTTPTTQADGDNTEFIGSWYVVGASVANYTITPTAYAANSIVRSASSYYVNTNVTSLTGSPFYFYQRQAGTVRKYQSSYITLTLDIENNAARPINMVFQIYSYFDTGNASQTGAAFTIESGREQLSSTILMPSLRGVTVGAAPYTEFRLFLNNFGGSNANYNVYLIKAEFGEISTPYYY